MKIDGKPYRTIWPTADGSAVEVIDQTLLPHRLVVARLAGEAEAARAINTMQVRGAPLIGVTGAYGLALALREDPSDIGLAASFDRLLATRPTAYNLRWALERVRRDVAPLAAHERAAAAFEVAGIIADEDVELCSAIGDHGLALFREIAGRKRQGERLNILTHCNAGWLACVDWGTAIAPVYKAHDAGMSVHVYVDETRPRNQGAGLTAFELGKHGVPHTVIVDNAGGHYMQQSMIDLCIVGTDRVTTNGDVANKIGTYLKALAARDNGVPFFVALPSPTIDWSLADGAAIPIEERSSDEVRFITGETRDGRIETVRVTPPESPAGNPAFDVTPARLVTALITERGICPASREGLSTLFPERAKQSA
ncbi:MAG: S-methyl-5-thioribose-1-phosphate isomerase [Alphaproteobacteria bacterium]